MVQFSSVESRYVRGSSIQLQTDFNQQNDLRPADSNVRGSILICRRCVVAKRDSFSSVFLQSPILLVPFYFDFSLLGSSGLLPIVNIFFRYPYLNQFSQRHDDHYLEYAYMVSFRKLTIPKTLIKMTET